MKSVLCVCVCVWGVGVTFWITSNLSDLIGKLIFSLPTPYWPLKFSHEVGVWKKDEMESLNVVLSGVF